MADASDCAPTDASKFKSWSAYADTDGDGYGTGSLVAVCGDNTFPTGYSTNNTDCAPNDATKYQLLNGYPDGDHDGYGNEDGVLQQVCSGASLPAGYSVNKTDCDDNDPSVYPGAPEICNDSIDNNCEGNIDENCTLVAAINAPSEQITVTFGDIIHFSGCGLPQSMPVAAYSWRLNNPEGPELSNKASFSYNLLPVGQHTIYFKVKGTNGIWSEADSVAITVEDAVELVDLAVTRPDITFLNADGQEIEHAENGEPIKIRVRIHNLSINDTQQNVKVYFYKGDSTGPQICEPITVTEIIPGDPSGSDATAKVIELNWTPPADCYDKYTVVTIRLVYANGTLDEATLQNNMASSFIVLGSPSPADYNIVVSGSISSAAPCFGQTVSISGIARYSWGSQLPVMGALVTVEVRKGDENGSLYRSLQGRTTSPSGSYCITFPAPSEASNYVVITRVNDKNLSGIDNNDIFTPQSCGGSGGSGSGSNISDLVAGALSFNGSSLFYIPCEGYSYAKTYAGSAVTVAGSVVNIGNQEFSVPGGFDVKFFSGSTEIYSTHISQTIGVGQSVPVACQWTPDMPGAYSLKISIAVSDYNTGNNIATRPLQVYDYLADIRPFTYSGCSRVSGLSFSQSRIVKGDVITVYGDVYNGGALPTGPFSVQFYNGDPNGCCGVLIGTAAIPSIAPGGSVKTQIQWDTGNSSEGTNEIFIVADSGNSVNEYDENNNRTSKQCYLYPQAADVYVNEVTFSNYGPQECASIDVRCTVENRGGGVSLPTFIDYYNGNPGAPGASLIGSFALPAIEPFTSVQSVLSNWQVPCAAGMYYIYAKIRSNGRKNFRQLNVYAASTPPPPDLRVYAGDIDDPGMPDIGAPVTFSATVYNDGSTTATNAKVSFWVDGDFGLTLVDTVTISALAGHCSMNVACVIQWTPAASGMYVLKVKAEPSLLQVDANPANNEATRSFPVDVPEFVGLSADSDCNLKDVFRNEPVYCRNNLPNLAFGQTYPIYVMYDDPTWFYGKNLTGRIPGTAETITAGSGCSLVAEQFPVSYAECDIVIDVDGDGVFGPGDYIDAGLQIGFSTLIKLSSFTAEPKRGEIILAWSTESEIDNAGFNIYRSESENGDYVKINVSLIPAEGSPTQSASYEFIDRDVKLWKTYFYKLEDVDFSGRATMHGPVSATPRLINMTK